MEPELIRDVFDWDYFFEHHFRKRPLFVPGGAETILSKRWSTDDFNNLRSRVLEAGESLSEREGVVTFIETASRFDDFLSDQARDMAAVFGAPGAWFDVIKTYKADGGGIGSHFDHSDNFVLQQEGTKVWRLGPADSVEPGLRSRRMLNEPGVGSHPLPSSGTVEFVVSAGDLLYIPLMWVHDGTSSNDSLSISLVVPAVSAFAAVIPLLSRVLKSQIVGGDVLPALHHFQTEEQLDVARDEVRMSTTALLASCSDPAVAHAIRELQALRLPGLLSG